MDSSGDGCEITDERLFSNDFLFYIEEHYKIYLEIKVVVHQFKRLLPRHKIGTNILSKISVF